MNEYSILLHLLTKKEDKKGTKIGTTLDEIAAALDFRGKNKYFLVHQILTQFQRTVDVFGLKIRYNSLTKHWFLAQDKQTIETFNENPFFSKPRLGATLLCIVVLSNLFGKATKPKLQEFRQVKDISNDLRDLRDLGFITYKDQDVFLTKKLGYYLDISQLTETIEKDQNLYDYEQFVNLSDQSGENDEENEA